MEIINTEIVVSSLLSAGFDQVDALLYTFVLGQLSLDNRELQMFEFSDNELSALFNQFVDYNGIIFRLKDGFSLKTNVSPVDGKVLPLEKALHTSKKLIDYFSQLDYKRIVLKKISTLYDDGVDNVEMFFSEKEKSIIHEMFGLSKLPHKTADITSFDSYEVFKRLIENINNRLISDQDDDLRKKRYEVCLKQRQEELILSRKKEND